jgi:predicted nucleic acid-binding protein
MKYLFDTDILIYWLKGNQAIERKAVAIGLENRLFRTSRET